MSKLKSKKLAAIALSSCMAICVGAAVGINAHKNFVTASADTAKYAVTETAVGTATVSQATPATIDLTGIKAGQYYLSVVITEGAEDWAFYDMAVTVGGETSYLSYNFSTKTFSGVVKVGEDDTLLLTTSSDKELTVSVDLGDLYLGADNDYTLGGVQIPAMSSVTVNLVGVEGNYRVMVDLGAVLLEEEATISVQVGNGEEIILTKDNNYYSAYTGTISVDGETTLTVYTTSTVAITADIMLNAITEYKELPSSIELKMWEAVTYKYTAVKTGYFSLNTASEDPNVELSITFRNDPESFEGYNVTENNYPLYMEAGQEYYFEFVLMNSSNGASATINTIVEGWKKPTIMTGTAYPVPVTAEGRDAVIMDVVAEAREYNLALMDVPFEYYMMGRTVTANVGDMVYYLNNLNGYSTDITLNGNTTIYLTTNATESTVLGLFIGIPEERHYIELGEATEIMVPGATMEDGTLIPGSAIYYIANATEGYYNIMLSDLSADASISVETDGLSALFTGNTAGGFKLRYGADYIVLEFLNHSTKDAEFKATVTKAQGEYDLTLGTANTVTINKGATAYYLEGLAVGNYELAVANLPEGATIFVDGESVDLNNGKAPITISEEQDNRGIITVLFMSNAAANITVTVTPLNIMKLNEVKTIATEGEAINMGYYMNLKAGEYSIVLDAPAGMDLTIMAGYNYAVYNGGAAGTFTVEEDSYVAIRISGFDYSGAETNSFRILVSDKIGTMMLGVEENIELTTSTFGKVYTMTGLVAGEYNIAVSSNDVKVYVDGYLVEGTSFFIWSDSCTIAFVSDVAVTFTAKVTPANILTEGENTVTIGVWTYSKTYFMELEEGEYEIYLTLNGVDVQVVYNGEEIIAYGADFATIEVTAKGYITLTFNVETFEEVTFSVEIYKAE